MKRFEKAPIGHAPVVESVERALRLRVTDVCPWRCSFCHSEGGRDTADLTWGPETKQVIESLRKALPSMHEVHFTGGEPTKNPELATIAAGLSALGLEVKTTTNGQFNKEQLERLIHSGLRSFNFSVHSLRPEVFREQQTGRGGARLIAPGTLVRKKTPAMEWATGQITRELAMILMARELGADVKINSVISSSRDIQNAREIMNWASEHRIPIRLLNDLGSGMESIEAIREFIRLVGAEEVLRKVTIGASACSTVYRMPDGYEFVFKQIRDFKLESMCRTCPRDTDGTCEERFYGVRLQKNDVGQYRMRLCLQETTPVTEMAIEEFLKSPQLEEIRSYMD